MAWFMAVCIYISPLSCHVFRLNWELAARALLALGSKQDRRCAYEEIQGCFRHWAAVALFSGSSSNMVSRKELNWAASSRGHSYLSSRISNKLHGCSLEMCRSCPVKNTTHHDTPCKKTAQQKSAVCKNFKHFTFSVEVFLGVSPREGELARKGPEQLDDVGDVV